MPISSLSESTVRAIGSSLVLNDAASVVKELIENALDAASSSIVVEISANTLDVIQVKDNGSGIGIEDRQLLCKRGCTSKIRSTSDLATLGGTFLGFRGQALASLAELSESVIVTTRIDGEVVGSTLRFGPNGTLLSSSSASHPTGTTFRVHNFLWSLPVRKQTAKKTSSSTLSKINKLLKSYAFARPHVRFSLRVLRAKNEKANWDYSPRIGKTCLLDVTAKVVGRDVAALCVIRSFTEQLRRPEISQAEPSYSIEAALPKACEDLSTLNHSECYVSVDGRLMNPDRGTIKDIVKLHRSYYQSLSRTAGSTHPIRPFLYLHVKCPPGSYDVNVEPSKDELLFADPSRLVSLAEQLFKNFYGGIDTACTENILPSEEARNKIPSRFDLLLAGKQSLSNPGNISSATLGDWPRMQHEDTKTPPRNMKLVENIPEGPREASSIEEIAHDDTERDEVRNALDYQLEGQGSAGKKAYANMFSIDETDLLEADSFPEVGESHLPDEDEREICSAKVTNPWSLAKLNAPPKSFTKPSRDQCSSPSKAQLITPRMDQTSSAKNFNELFPQNKRVAIGLVSPAASSSPTIYQNPGPPLRRRLYRTDEDELDEIRFTQGEGSQEELSSGTLLDFGVESSSKSAQQLPTFRKASTFLDRNGRIDPSPSWSCDTLQRMPLENSLSGGSLVNQPFDGFWKPFRVPKRSSGAAEMTVGHAHEGGLNRNESSAVTARPNMSKLGPSTDFLPSRPGRDADPASLSSTQPSFKASQDSATELNDILEFEKRKKAVNIQQRKLTGKFTSPNPATLAQIQRKAIPSHPAFQNNLSLLDVTEEPSNPAREITRGRRGSQHTDAEETTFRSPHMNRYLAAKASLLTNGDVSSASPRPNSGNSPPIPPDDPRAYLMRHSDPSLSKSGLTIRRTQTSRLPLETIPPACAVHRLATNIDPTLTAIRHATIAVAETDEYPVSGRVEPVSWSPTARDIPVWEARLTELIRAQYVARVGNAGHEVVPEELAFALHPVFKAHQETYGI